MKTAVIKTFILLIVLLTAAAFPYRAYAEESVIIDGYSADIPPELEKSLSDAGITPQSIEFPIWKFCSAKSMRTTF